MKQPGSRPSIDNLDRYLAQKEYSKALTAINDQLRRRPGQLNLQLRRAEVLDQQGAREKAIEAYRSVAESQAREGFYARAIAVYKKILRLDPGQDVGAELARLIEEDQQSRRPARRRPETNRSAEDDTCETTDEEAAIDQEVKELHASTLFSSFDRETLKEIIDSTLLRSFCEGDIVVTEGEPGSSLFLIVTGGVKVFTRTDDGGHLPLAELGPGDFFGEVSLLTGKPRTATITAHTPVTAIELDRTDVDRIAESHPEVHKVLDDFCNRRAQETVEAVIHRMRGEG
ncbi:MAG: cyclic nucleotide-binding domain-containing protein [Thermoanaerobaculales bacterium]